MFYVFPPPFLCWVGISQTWVAVASSHHKHLTGRQALHRVKDEIKLVGDLLFYWLTIFLSVALGLICLIQTAVERREFVALKILRKLHSVAISIIFNMYVGHTDNHFLGEYFFSIKWLQWSPCRGFFSHSSIVQQCLSALTQLTGFLWIFLDKLQTFRPLIIFFFGHRFTQFILLSTQLCV